MASARRPSSRPPLNLLLWSGSLVTLFLWPGLHDPLNAPKSWILSVVGVWLLGWIAFQIRDHWKIEALKWATVVASAFVFLLSVSFAAGNNKYTSFFGEYQRKTGYLSYLCLIVFFITASYLIRLDNLARLEIVFLTTGFIIGIYGFLQHFKRDFVQWDNPFNPVISTLGNPDFAAAAMSIILIICFGITIQSKHDLWLRIFAGANTILLFIAIEFSQVRQGLIMSILGVVIILIIWTYQKQRYLAFGLSLLSATFGVVAIFGMINQGPLAKYLYKISVTYRGDYWRAGWRMFIRHPLVGVGLDRYGAYFREYRDRTQSLRRGPGFVSTAAHNIPIQLAATGGILLLLGWVALTLFIAVRGLIALKRTQGAQQVLVGTIFAAWIAYLAQSLISIDNLAIALWGYILGGTLVGISVTTDTSKKIMNSTYQRIVSGSLALVLIIVCGICWAEESATNEAISLPKPQNQTQVAIYKTISKKPLSYIFKEPTMEFLAAAHLVEISDFPEAIAVLRKIIIWDPRQFEAHELLARIYENQKNWGSAIPVRHAIAKLDPYNQINLLQLGEDYKSSGDISSAKGIIPLINAVAPDSTEDKQALKDFGKQH